MQHYDYLIVGAGLFGSVFAYKAKQQGKKMPGYRSSSSFRRKYLL